MNDLPNLDHYDDIERGEQQQTEPAKPHDAITQARLLADAIPGVSLANDLPANLQVLLGDNCL